MGNPHAIVYMDDIDHLDIEKIGPAFENHVAFPDRVNTEFVEVIDEHTVKCVYGNAVQAKLLPAAQVHVR